MSKSCKGLAMELVKCLSESDCVKVISFFTRLCSYLTMLYANIYSMRCFAGHKFNFVITFFAFLYIIVFIGGEAILQGMCWREEPMYTQWMCGTKGNLFQLQERPGMFLFFSYPDFLYSLSLYKLVLLYFNSSNGKHVLFSIYMQVGCVIYNQLDPVSS